MTSGHSAPQEAPGAVSWGPGRIDVFVRGGAGGLKNRWFESGYGWTYGFPDYFGTLGGDLTSPPVVASPGSGRLNVFTRRTDGRLSTITAANGGWGGWDWDNPPNPCCLALDVWNSVAVTSRSPLTLDVFVIGTDYFLYRRAYDYYHGGWGNWQLVDNHVDWRRLDNRVFTNIAATAWAPPPPPPPPPHCGPLDNPCLPQ